MLLPAPVALTLLSPAALTLVVVVALAPQESRVALVVVLLGLALGLLAPALGSLRLFEGRAH